MKKFKRALKILGFVLLLLMAFVGIGLPIPLIPKERLFSDKYVEQIDENEDSDQSDETFQS